MQPKQLPWLMFHPTAPPRECPLLNDAQLAQIQSYRREECSRIRERDSYQRCSRCHLSDDKHAWSSGPKRSFKIHEKRNPCRFRHIFVTGAMTHTQEISVQLLKGREQTKFIHPTAKAISTEPSANVLTYLTPTPIVVTKLEDTLAGHPDTRLVSQSCPNWI